MFKPRPAQEDVLAYRQGTMGVSAVPGSGKTWTLSRLAASLISTGALGETQEVLVVTLVNAAVDNFKSRIGAFLREEGLIPGVGYRVSTLHSLAYDIVAQAPSHVGLAEVNVVDDRIGEAVLQGAFRACYRHFADELEPYLSDDIKPYRRARIVRENLPGALQNVVRAAIKHLKSRRLTPRAARDHVSAGSPVLVRLTLDVYERYQRGLSTRGTLDFDDLILHAIAILEHDADLRMRLRSRWPYILEDEAQDSSALQEKILRVLGGDDANWVRVGDPNQAIYETFTTANPKYLRAFLKEADACCPLPNSGRSGRPIIRLANELIRWTQEAHPIPTVRDALFPPRIEPTPPGDPQPNPPDSACQIVFYFRGETPAQELANLITSLKKWLPDHPDNTVAVLVPTHRRAAEVIGALQKEDLRYSDALLRLTTSTREAAGALCFILRHLANPVSEAALSRVYTVWFFRILGSRQSDESRGLVAEHVKLLKQCPRVEDYLWPRSENDWLESLGGAVPEKTLASFEAFRAKIQEWHGLVLLPIDELLTTLAQDLFDDPEKLAMTQLFGDILQQRTRYYLGADQPPTTLSDLQQELEVIAKDKRRLQSIEANATAFDPTAHRGEVVVATMHGAKGMEWDRVYLLTVNDYEFPSGEPGDRFRAEKWFVRDNMSLEAETLAQLDTLLDGTDYIEGEATQEARYDYARERLRLLYVGITRARKELIATSNTGPRETNQPARAFLALQAYLDQDGNP